MDAELAKLRNQESVKNCPDPKSAIALYELISKISEDIWAASWVSGVEFDLYRVAEGRTEYWGSDLIDEENIYHLRELCINCAGWWRCHPDTKKMEFVRLEQWNEIAAGNQRSVQQCPDPEAAIALFKVMRDLSEEVFADNGCQYILWQAIQDDTQGLDLSGILDEPEILEVKQLSVRCDGWWNFEDHPNFIRLKKWIKSFEPIESVTHTVSKLP